MDESKVRAIVRENAETEMRRLGLPHWTVDFHYDLRLSTAERTVKGRCTRLVDYNRAVIELDPDALDDEADVLRIVRHELLHVVLSPFDLFRQVAEGTWDADPAKGAMMDRLWDHASEQAVINLERMYQGLTDNHQQETPAMGRQKPVSAAKTTKVSKGGSKPKTTPKGKGMGKGKTAKKG